MTDLFNHDQPIITQWRDTAVEIQEQRTILHNQTILSEIPDSYRHVTINGWSEVQDYETLSDNQFKVNYQTGIIDFGGTVSDGTTVSTDYWGKGVILISADRVFSFDKDTNIRDNLQELIDNGQQGIDALNKVGKFVYEGKYDSATSYVVNNMVLYQGSTYICIQDSTGNPPNDTTYWSLMASSGQGNITPHEQSWVASGNQSVFTTTDSYNPNTNSLELYIAGIRQASGVNYGETDSNTITVSGGIDEGTLVEAWWFTNNAVVDADITTLTGYGSNIGDTSKLTTASKVITSAINEINNEVSTNTNDINMNTSNISTNTKNIGTNTTNIGDNSNKIGVLSSLNTTDQTDLVGATNEVLGDLNTHKAETASDDVHSLVSDGKVIEESGSNANGEYVRFANGWQMCIQNIQLSYTNTYSLSGTWTYPKSFTVNPALSETITENAFSPSVPEIKGVHYYAIHLSSCTPSLIRIDGKTDFRSGDTASVKIMAWGKWK